VRECSLKGRSVRGPCKRGAERSGFDGPADLVDAIETVSEHFVSAHVHDNRGRTDDHLVPFEGTIDWPAALTAVLKVGYDGTLLVEIAAHGSPKNTLRKAQQARRRMEGLLHE